MAQDSDQDPLSWAGDESARDIDEPRVVLVDAPPLKKPMPAIVLVTYGVIAGAYLIYTIGWVITVARSTITLPNLFGELMFQGGELLAIASPAIWFAGALYLTRHGTGLLRLALLLLGLLVVVPWPFLLGV